MSNCVTIQEIWPRPKLALSSLLPFKEITHSTIEEFFEEVYPNTYAVIMPSGRSALRLILHYSGLKRSDFFAIPKYSSHCIINSVGMVATPIQHIHDKTTQSIIFHQWGFTRKEPTLSVLIEDSVDSLIPKGGNVFPNDGRFEIISLTKVFGTFIGGLILCQNQHDATKLKQQRDSTNILGQMHFYLRMAGQISPKLYTYWNNAEPLNTLIPTIGLRDIWDKIRCLDELIDDRCKKIAALNDLSLNLALPLPCGRFPCCWPISVKKWLGANQPTDQIIRHIHGKKGGDSYQQVLPLPIHQQVSIATIKKWITYGY
jgi:putative PLP-dependent aminotransferase (TIGR04422 family)